MSHDPTPAEGNEHAEARAVAERYARRDVGDRYNPLRAEIWQTRQDRQRALISLLRRHAPRPMAELDVLEVGCGSGDNLLELLQLGFDPARLVANELLPQRLADARRRLPGALALHGGDALALALPDAGFDIVLQSTVFTSLLDDDFQQKLADRMWRWLRPGGGVLWYDFTWDNPRNRDVRAVPQARVRELFPAGTVHSRRVTLAPPLARAVCRVHPSLYTVLNALPMLRTHLLAWIAKPPDAAGRH